MELKCNSCNNDLIIGNNWTIGFFLKAYYKCKVCSCKLIKSSNRYRSARTTSTQKKVFNLVLSRKISNFIKDAKRRGWLVELNYLEVGHIMKKPCHYCGENRTNNGIDRVDSSLGYFKNNIVPCCKQCNFGKNSYSPEEFISHCKKVVSFQGVE
jgi:hypothetical protein